MVYNLRTVIHVSKRVNELFTAWTTSEIELEKQAEIFIGILQMTQSVIQAPERTA